MAAGATYEPMATTTLSSNQTSVTFSNISQAYTDLVIVINNFGMNAGGSAARMRFNGDTGANYSNQALVGTGSSTVAGRESNQTSVRIMGAQIGPSTTNTDTAIINIFDYSGAYGYRTILVKAGGVNETYALVGWWANVNGITSLELRSYNGTDTILSGTVITLYGIAAA